MGSQVGSTSHARRRFSVAEVEHMVRVGILDEDEHVELLDGELIVMSAASSDHAGCVNRLNRILARELGARALLSVQNPVVLDEYSCPEPDVAVLRPRDDDYTHSHPRPADVLWLIEVGVSRVELDRTVKAPLYAAAGVCELWLVDLKAEQITVCRQPSSDGYGELTVLGRGQPIRPEAFPDLELTVDDVLG